MTSHLRIALFLTAGSLASVASAGPDVIVAEIPNAAHFGELDGIHAYAFGTTECNIGDEQLAFFANTNEHPVITQNLFRLTDGRFEQIGQGWVLHGFFALQQAHCGTCIPAQNGQYLGVGCSDVITAGLNGSQFGMGGRSEIDASTGGFSFPPAGAGPADNVLDKRLQASESDLSTPGARYFVDATYIAADDAAAGNGMNNPAWREFLMLPNFNIALTGETRRHEPAIFAWAEADSQVLLESTDVAGDGRFWVGSRVYDNGDGTFDYEYAVYNLNSDRSVGAFSVSIGSATASGIGFHDVSYHSGEPFDGTDWAGAAAGRNLAWDTDDFATNENANAIRWGTMYNFRFTADQQPGQGDASIGLFKPGAGAEASVRVWMPLSSACPADFTADGVLNFFDVQEFLTAFATQNPAADYTDEGAFNFFDVAAFLSAFAAGCP